jgi:predicted nuclease of predicted toxin-antitoxin system
MKFLADVHVSREMIAMIRELGDECREGSSIPPRLADVDVLMMAAERDEVVITADKDFGELVFVHRIPCPGVVLIRVALPDESQRVARVRSVWPSVLSRVPGSFVTVTLTRVRARPLR